MSLAESSPVPWYVPNEANRNSCHRIKVGEDLVLALKPGETQWSTVKSADETGGKRASLVHRDTDSQQLIIKHWIVDTPALSVKVAPLTGPVSLPKHP